MKNFESVYIKILSNVIELFHVDRNSVDPKMINKAKFYTRALFMAISYVSIQTKAEKKISLSEVNFFFKQRFGDNNLFSYLINSASNRLVKIFDNENIPISNLPLGSLYENLLNVETTGKEITTGKEYRNKLGSYYTPQKYAQGITTLALQSYLNQNVRDSIFTAKFVDFSCGCGIFLISALSYLRQMGLKDEELRTVVLHLYACDVDPIALEIAKISVLDYCNAQDSYDILSRNFHHANFLLHTDSEQSREKKICVAMDGYIYHQTLAVGVSFLQEYDVILGNPPWEKIRFEEKKFYSQYIEQIGFIHFKFELSSSIEDTLKSNNYIREYSQSYVSQLEQAKMNIKRSTFFKDSTRGELNTCTLFSDAAYKLLSENGSAGLFVKSSLVTTQINSHIFSKISNRITAVYDFINRRKIFAIDSRERFAILLLGKRTSNKIRLGMNLLSFEEIDNKIESVSIGVFEKLNPKTKMIPNFSSSKDIKILSELYNRLKIFSVVYPNAKFGRLVHLTNHIADIDKIPLEDNLPVFEGKFFSLFDNSFSGFNDVPMTDRYKSKVSSKKISESDKKAGVKPLCRFYVKKAKWDSLSKDYASDYMVAWHSLTSATNVRSCVASLMPFVPGAQSVQFLTLPNNEDMIYTVGIFNSIVYDYIIKCKLNGIDLTQAVINQIPLPSPQYAQNFNICLNGKETTAWNCIYDIVSCFYQTDDTVNQIFRIQNNVLYPTERGSLFILLDAVVARLYGIDVDEFKYITEHFKEFYSPKQQSILLEIFKDISRQ